MPPFALYVHIPFCRSRCTYCDFNTYAGLESLATAYVEAVVAEAGLWAPALSGRDHGAGGVSPRRHRVHGDGEEPAAGQQAHGGSTSGRSDTGVAHDPDGAPPGMRLPLPNVCTVYLGGGTPSILGADQVERLLSGLAEALPWSAGAEVSTEANPADLNEDYLARLRRAGINRLSLGVQTFDADDLRLLGRRHDAETAERAIHLARRAGIDNLSLDLIYGLPGQSLATWRRNLERALDLRPDHLSLYALTLEEGTPLAQAVEIGRIAQPDPDLAADMYTLAEEYLEAAGYVHYEISNWAQPGRECQHNLVYWRREPYLGLGAGAHSCLGDWRFSNLRRPQDYLRAIANAHTAGRSIHFPFPSSDSLPPFVDTAEHVGADAAAAEALILGLRLGEGVARSTFAQRFGRRALEVYEERLYDALTSCLVEERHGRWHLTERGRLLSNQVFYRLLPEGPLDHGSTDDTHQPE